jgi:hypothetical protein
MLVYLLTPQRTILSAARGVLWKLERNFMVILLGAGRRRYAFGIAILHKAASSANVERGSWRGQNAMPSAQFTLAMKDMTLACFLRLSALGLSLIAMASSQRTRTLFALSERRLDRPVSLLANFRFTLCFFA